MAVPCAIRFPELNLREYARNWGIDDTTQALALLGRAIAASHIWDNTAHLALVIKQGEPPVLCLLGMMDRGFALRFQTFLNQLQFNLNLVRYASYREAERACARLADNLVAALGRNTLANARFTAIPRGGYIVLGMLSYLLDLRHDQLYAGSDDAAALQIVVDDCAFTGVRFGAYLREATSGPVVFAPLWSHPELRAAILAKEKRVVDVVSGADLHDYGLELMGDGYGAWRQLWSERNPDSQRLYWLGRTEILCFPWSEPDSSFWNPFTEQVERGWNYAPPAYCLKHRALHYQSHVPVRIQPEGHGQLRPSANAVYAVFDDQVIIGHLETGHAFQLTDVGAAMWRSIVDRGDFESTINAVADQYAVERAELAHDLAEFIDQLIARDLLQTWQDDEAA